MSGVSLSIWISRYKSDGRRVANPSLQRFKLNIASSVVTQQNAGLGSMNTGEVLDLFKVSAEDDPAQRKAKIGGAGAAGGGPVSASKVLEG